MGLEPFNLTLSLTHRCDLRCRYCYGGAPRPASMSRATGRAAIRLAFETASPDALLDLRFFGGEPLLEFDLLQHLTRYANDLASRRGRPIQFGLTTNGTHLTAEALAWLRSHRFALAVSADGTPQMHDGHRVYANGRGSSRVVFARLEAALKQFPRLVVAMTVTPETAAGLARGVAHLFRLGVRHFEVTPNYDAVWTDRAVEDLRAALAELAAFYAEHFTEVSISCLDDKLARALPGGDRIRCGFGETAIAVAPSGRLYPCERLIGEDRDPRWVMGTVQTGLDPHRRHASIAQRKNDGPRCRNCPDAGACRNACPCVNLARTGRPDRSDDFICTYERALMESALAVLHRVAAARRQVYAMAAEEAR